MNTRYTASRLVRGHRMASHFPLFFFVLLCAAIIGIHRANQLIPGDDAIKLYYVCYGYTHCPFNTYYVVQNRLNMISNVMASLSR